MKRKETYLSRDFRENAALRFPAQAKELNTAFDMSLSRHLHRIWLPGAVPQKQYRTNFPIQPDAKVACWYGEKEGHMKKAIQRLRKAYPGLIVRCFPGFGHGEIINHPALLASELERFLTDGGTERCAEESGK